jgi:uncharacterized RmlC-like cupin family protein
MSDTVQAIYAPIRVVRPEELSGATAQTAGMDRSEAISGRTVGARHLWMGRTIAPAGKVSGVHHHGESETALYVLKGSAVLFFGEGLRERVEVRAGDFAFVPAWAVHAEGNLGAEDAEAVVVRSSQEAIVVNLPALRVPEEALATGGQGT